MGALSLLSGFLVGSVMSLAGWTIGYAMSPSEAIGLSLGFTIVSGGAAGLFSTYSTWRTQARVYIGNRSDMLGFYGEFFFRAFAFSAPVALVGLNCSKIDTLSALFCGALVAGFSGPLCLWLSLRKIDGLAATYTDQADPLALVPGKVGNFRFQSQSGTPIIRQIFASAALFPTMMAAMRDDETQTVSVEKPPEYFRERLEAGLGDWTDEGVLKALQNALDIDGRFPGYLVQWVYALDVDN